MITFFTQYIDPQGVRRRDLLQATDLAQAQVAIRAKASLVLTLEQAGPWRLAIEKIRLRVSGRRIGPVGVQRFAHRLGAYLKAGIPIQEALRLLGEADSGLAPLASTLRERLAAGETLDEAMRVSGFGFPPAFMASVRAAAEAGQLPQVLASEAQRLAALQEIRRDLVSSLVYPAALVVMCVGVVFFMLAFIVPQVRASLPDEAMERLGGVPSVIFALSDGLAETSAGLLFCVLFLAAGCAFYGYQKTGAWRSRVVLALPMLGPALRALMAADFCRSFGTMLQASVRAERAWQLSTVSVSNAHVRRALEQAGEKLVQGMSLSVILLEAAVFPSDVAAVFALGERTGTLPALLLEASEFQAGEALARLRKLSSMAAPVIILLAGLIVGVFAVAMMTTILSVNQVYGG